MNHCGATWLRGAGWLAICLLLPGCNRAPSPPGQRTPPNPRAPAAYGQPSGPASTQIARVSLPSGAPTNGWAVPFGVVQTELSPALLVHSEHRTLDLFAGSTNFGLGAPTFVAWSTMNGPRSFKRGETLDVTRMRESWVLVWWAGSENWTDWDAPWVAYLQHQPSAMRLDEDGLHLEFARAAGDVVLLPLYGYEKLPQKGHNFLAAHGLTGRKVRTWDWSEVLKRDPLTRIRYWGSALRDFPIYCAEDISVDRTHDAVTLRSQLRWHAIADDWHTPRLKLCPISPPLGLVAKLGGFPVTFSRPWFDLDLATPFGPCVAVEGAAEFDATFHVLQYVHETERAEPPATNATPGLAQAWQRLQAEAAAFAQSPLPNPQAGSRGRAKPVFAELEQVRWLAIALPYLDPGTRSITTARLRQSFRELFLAESPAMNSENSLATSAGPEDPGAVLLQALWAYAHASGDWDLVRERWTLVKRQFTGPAATRWVGFGRDGAAELGDQAGAAGAFARLAYRIGDMDAYHYACAQFARELVVLFFKQRGAEYFRAHQPWHSLEFMDEEIFPTHLANGVIGWRLDGPKYPAPTLERLFERRWRGFGDQDLARFYREWLPEDVRRELAWSGTLPAPLVLRSLLLNEGAAGSATNQIPSADPFAGSPAAVVANCVALLRASHPTHYERLIPPGPPSPFVAGLEREVAGPNAENLTSVTAEPSGGGYRLVWPAWKSPSGAEWTFGSVRSGPARGLHPSSLPITWNTRMVVNEKTP